MWILLALASAIIYSAQWSISRASHQKIPSSVLTLAYNILGPILAIGVFFFPIPSTTITWVYLAYIFLVNPIFSWLSMHVVQRMPVSLSQPISSFAIVSSIFTGWFFFNAQFSILGLLGIIIGFIGLWLLYHSNWSQWSQKYPWLLVLCMLNFGIVATLSGQILQIYPHPIIVSGIGLTGAISASGIGVFLDRKKINIHKETIVMLIFTMISNIIGEVILLMALGMTNASYVISVKRVSIVLTALIGYSVFRERQTPFWRLVTATLIITLGVILMAFR